MICSFSRSIALALLSTLAAAAPQEPPPGPDPVQLVAELAGPGKEAAYATLVGSDPELSFDALFDCVQQAPFDHAWMAGRVLRRQFADAPKSKAWKSGADRLASIVLDQHVLEANRCIAALSLYGSGAHAKSSFEDLAELLATATAPVRLAVALAAGGLDGKFASEAKGLLKDEGLTRALWTVTALACMGSEASSSKKALSKLVEDDESLTAFLVCRSARIALGEVAGDKAVQKPWEKRLKAAKGRQWQGGYNGLNFGAAMPRSTKSFFQFYSLHLKVGVRDHTKMPLPENLDDALGGGSSHSLADGAQSMGKVLTLEVLDVHAKLRVDTFADWKAWEDRVAPLLELADFLQELDQYSHP